MFLVNAAAHIMPYLVIMWDSGFYSTINNEHLSDFLESWSISKMR